MAQERREKTNRVAAQKRDDGLGYVEQHVFPELFGSNHAAAFAYKKTQRVSAALHLVTDALSENEPMRAELRAEALGLVRDALTASAHRKYQSASKTRCSERLTRIITLLDVARTAAIISEMNAAVLMRECASLDQLYTRAARGQEADFDPLFFEVSDTASEQMQHTHSSRHERGQKEKYIKDKKTEETKDSFDNKEQRKDTSQTSSRRKAILDLVSKKGRINVKDVSNVVFDCSEKTLQRELLALVREGVLKKEGERRWSTYLLAE